MIAHGAEKLNAAYLSILEVGGAFAFRFQKLIEFLGLPTLIVTDLDSVYPPKPKKAADAAPEANEDASAQGDSDAVEDEEEDDDLDDEAAAEGDEPKPSSKCPAGTAGAVTANQTLRQWLPGKILIEDLLAATPESKLQAPHNGSGAHVMVTYQCPVTVTWGTESAELKSRTLEEAFAYENLEWCQKKEHHDLKLRWSKAGTMPLADLASRIHTRVKGQHFKKTNFALGLLASSDATWVVPTYIQQGLDWLTQHVAIVEEETDDTAEVAGADEVPAQPTDFQAGQ
jgi:hypothetical protein